MRLTKTTTENLGKVFLNLGQGMILGVFVSGFLEEKLRIFVSIITFFLGVYTIYVGLYFISESVDLEG